MSPNITLYIRETDDPIWADAKKHAEKEGVSLSEVVTDALRLLLTGTSAAEPDILTLLAAAIQAEKKRRRGDQRTMRTAKSSLLKKLKKVKA